MTVTDTHHEEVLRWFKRRAEGLNFMLTLTFSRDVTDQEVEEALHEFVRRASTKIAGNRGRKGQWKLRIVAIKERQPISGRWHIHALVGWPPTEHRERINMKGGYRKILADSWSSLYGAGRIDLVGGNGERMKFIDDGAKGYLVKSNNLKYQKSDLFIMA